MKALPYEGAADIHRLFVQTHMQVGLQSMRASDWAAAIRAIERSKEYPESLGTGKPYHPDYRPQDYLLGWIYERQGLREKAEEAFRAVLAYTDRAPARRSAGAWFGARALQRAGRQAEADELLKKAVEPSLEILEIVKP
jgi:tetratricopeptide (TPR) repeat protein